MVWGCFPASQSGQFTIILNSSLYKKVFRIMWDHVLEYWRWTESGPFNVTMTQSITINLPRILRVLELPCQSRDQNPIQMLWKDLKRTVHANIPPNIHSYKNSAWRSVKKILPSQCQVVSTIGSNSRYRAKNILTLCIEGNGISHLIFCWIIAFQRHFLYFVQLNFLYILFENKILICPHFLKKKKNLYTGWIYFFTWL